MGTAHITKRLVDSLQASAVEYFVWDEKLAGFGVRVQPAPSGATDRDPKDMDYHGPVSGPARSGYEASSEAAASHRPDRSRALNGLLDPLARSSAFAIRLHRALTSMIPLGGSIAEQEQA